MVRLVVVLLPLIPVWWLECVAEEEVGSPLRVAQCRAKCIYNFGNASDLESCTRDSDCLMCWEKCQLLESNFVVWGAACSNTADCSSGCQFACQFHAEGTPQRAPVLVTQGHQVIYRDGHLASWPRHDLPAPVIYVVMHQQPGMPWRQLLQTMYHSASVPEGEALRVLVVGRDGLITIYSPSPTTTPPVMGVREVLRHVDPDALRALRLPAPGNRRINSQHFSEPPQNPLVILKNVNQGWNLREMSLIHQKVLVIAEITWNPQQSPEKAPGVYFVTWEVDGGGLRGNLFTDSTSVTLSLWPDTVYHIRVQLVRGDWKHGSQSEQLVVDTHTASGHHQSNPSVTVLRAAQLGLTSHPHSTMIAAAVASVITLLLALTGVLIARYFRPHDKDVMDDKLSSIHKDFPPPVRLQSNHSIPSVCGGTPST